MLTTTYIGIWSAVGLLTLGLLIIHHAFERSVLQTQDLWVGTFIVVLGLITGIRSCPLEGP